MTSRKLFIVSVYFPPINSIASNRILAFAKYIDKTLFDVEVVTLKTNESENQFSDINPIKITRFENKSIGLLKFNGTESFFVHKLKALYNKVFQLLFTSGYNDWQRQVEHYLSNEISKYSNPLVLTSFSPVEPHLAALNLKLKSMVFYWIADFRDEMNNPSLNRRLNKAYLKIQNEVLKNSNLVLSVSEPILNQFKTAIPHADKYLEIRNGYDFELDYEYKSDKQKFTISHIGNFYGNRKPYSFFQGLKIFTKKHGTSQIEVNLIGSGNSIKIPKEMEGFIHCSSKISHDDALKLMKDSNALLLIHPAGGHKGVYTGKIFEYLASLRPIIALIDTEDVAAQLIKDCNAGFVCDFENIEEIANAIEKAFLDWKYQKYPDFNMDLIQRHHRKNQVMILNQYLSTIN